MSSSSSSSSAAAALLPLPLVRAAEPLDPLAPLAAQSPPDTAFVSDAFVPRQQLVASRFYREWMRPNNMDRWIGGLGLLSPNRIVAVAFQRPASDLSRIDRGLIDRALSHEFIAYELVLAVEEEDTKLFSSLVL